jgi:hypothetical protein
MMNESLLQIKTQPNVYVKLVQEAKPRRSHMEDGDEYWSLLPLYGVARCPYCNAVYTEKMDTYTLRQWIVWGADMESWRSLLTFPPRSDYEDWYDLEKWVKAGKLSWIEPENPEMELVSGPPEAFPYKNLEGRKRPYKVGYRDGRVFEDIFY